MKSLGKGCTWTVKLLEEIHKGLNDKDLDPSKIYELYGKNGIIQFLRSATKIDEIYL